MKQTNKGGLQQKPHCINGSATRLLDSRLINGSATRLLESGLINGSATRLLDSGFINGSATRLLGSGVLLEHTRIYVLRKQRRLVCAQLLTTKQTIANRGDLFVPTY